MTGSSKCSDTGAFLIFPVVLSSLPGQMDPSIGVPEVSHHLHRLNYRFPERPTRSDIWRSVLRDFSPFGLPEAKCALAFGKGLLKAPYNPHEHF